MTAASVPSCKRTSKTNVTVESNFQPSSHGTRIRCAEDETGMNSVRPCTIPRMRDWRRVIEICSAQLICKKVKSRPLLKESLPRKRESREKFLDSRFRGNDVWKYSDTR